MLRSMGLDAYSVIARSIATTLSKKSMVSVKGLCFVKRNCLDCRADQRRSATYLERISEVTKKALEILREPQR